MRACRLLSRFLGIVSNMGAQYFIWRFRITGGSAKFINVVDDQGTPGVLEFIASPRWRPRVNLTGGAVKIFLIIFYSFDNIHKTIAIACFRIIHYTTLAVTY